MTREQRLEEALCKIYTLSHWLCPDYENLFEQAQGIAAKALETSEDTFFAQYQQKRLKK